MSKLKPLIGLSDYCYAILTQDDTAGVSYNTPVLLKGARNAKYNPNGAIACLFTDDGPSVTADSIGEIDLEIEIADLSQEDEAAMMGHTISNGILIKKATDVSPEVAFGFKAKRSGGAYSYIWLLKGVFSKPSTDYSTKEDKIKFGTPKFQAKFSQREFDGQYHLSTRTDAAGYQSSIGANWFSAVPSATPDIIAPTVTTVPADAATAVVVSANMIATFSEAIAKSCITVANFILVKATDGTVVDGTLTYNANQTVITFDPTVNLTAATAYIWIISTGVKDLAGNALALPCVSNFQTA